MSTSFQIIYNLLKLQFSHPFTKVEKTFTQEKTIVRKVPRKISKESIQSRNSISSASSHLMYLLYFTFCPLFRESQEGQDRSILVCSNFVIVAKLFVFLKTFHVWMTQNDHMAWHGSSFSHSHFVFEINEGQVYTLWVEFLRAIHSS